MMNSAARRAANNPLAAGSASGLLTDLRRFAREHLPEAMIPARFVVVDELPKLPNGKVDRSRLPAADAGDGEPGGGPAGAAAYVPPTTPDELRIAQIWRDILGRDRIGIEESFFDLGGDSLTAVQMAARVREQYGVALSLRRLFEHPTVGALARMVGGDVDGPALGAGSPRSLSAAELAAEAVLPADVVPERDALPPAAAPYRSVLLTGGTGYTGAFLVRELLDRSAAEIYVLARADDAADAVDRVHRNMAVYGLWRDGDERRLRGVAGDVARPYFGLSRAAYTELAERAEIIVHNGALSSFALPYRQLKPINVLGTQEVLRLACRRRIKPVHFISSLAAFPALAGVSFYAEEPLSQPEGVVGGYRQTKYVADRMMSQAGERGVPVCIYRPGQIGGAQTTGACSTDTFLNSAMKGCIQLGAGLEFDAMLEMVPVDFCAAAVAHIALSGDHHGRQFHLPGARSVRWSELLDMLRALGYRLRRVPYRTWYRELLSSVERGEDNALTDFLPLFDADRPSEDLGDEGGVQHFERTNLVAALEGTGIVCRPVDLDLLRVYVDYFVSIGYLAPPAAERLSA